MSVPHTSFLKKEKFFWFLFVGAVILGPLIFLKNSSNLLEFHLAEVGVLFTVGLLLLHPPLKKHEENFKIIQSIKKRELHLYILFVYFFVIFGLMLEVYRFNTIRSWNLLGVLIILSIVSIIVSQIIDAVAHKFRSKQHIFILALLVSIIAATGLLLFDLYLYLIFILILIHWYAYTTKEINRENIKKDLLVFILSFFQAGFLFLFVRYIEETIRLQFMLPRENIISYLILGIGITATLYNHLIGTKHTLHYQYGIISEPQYFLKLYKIFVFDAQHSKLQRSMRKFAFVLMCIAIVVMLLYGINRIEMLVFV